MSQDIYQNWALQWTLFQQAQQAAAYQNQLYQSFTNQQKPSPSPVPPPPSSSNNFNPQQQHQTNNNMNITQSKWQPSSKNLKN
jgi:hypothetical protein